MKHTFAVGTNDLSILINKVCIIKSASLLCFKHSTLLNSNFSYWHKDNFRWTEGGWREKERERVRVRILAWIPWLPSSTPFQKKLLALDLYPVPLSITLYCRYTSSLYVWHWYLSFRSTALLLDCDWLWVHLLGKQKGIPGDKWVKWSINNSKIHIMQVIKNLSLCSW